MSEERLSRLQKWILKALFIIGTEYNVRAEHLKKASVLGLDRTFGKSDIGSPFSNKKIKINSLHVAFSRSFRNLVLKDLIFAFSTNPLKEIRGIAVFDENLGNLKDIGLTDKGEAKAKELLNVKNPKLNNKD